MRKNDLQRPVRSFARQIKSLWQMVFLPAALLYGGSLMHYFFAKPAVNSALDPYLRNIDLVSYILAAILTISILQLKRQYFAKRFVRKTVEGFLKKNPELEDEDLLKKLFNILRNKMLIVWLLGLALVLDGVIFYWLTFIPGNMNIYFMIGAFSLFVNYPRDDLFFDIPYYVHEARQDFGVENDE